MVKTRGYVEEVVVDELKQIKGIDICKEDKEISASEEVVISHRLRGKIDFLINHCNYRIFYNCKY